MDFSIFQQLGVALALSSLIGLEREQRSQLEGYDTFGGIRTFSLIGLIGALAYFISKYSPWFFVIITAGVIAFMVAAYILTSKKHGGAGATSEVAGILVYIIGVLCAMKLYLLATVVALAVLLILHFKDPLHKWAKHLKNTELVSTIQFMIITFVILPLLPNQYYGPYGFFNPYLVWLMVVFISGISFLSYIAIKIFGARKGIFATGFLAGFISSTALAFSFSAESKKNQNIVYPYVLAVVVAGTAMFFRVMVELSVLNRELVKLVAVPLLAMILCGIIISVFLFLKKEKVVPKVETDSVKLKSPFSLLPALKFAVFFVVVLFLTKFAAAWMGDKGIYLTSIISGIFDVDAITVSMANLAKNSLSESVASKAIVIAAIVNTLSKAGIFLLFGARKVAFNVVAVFAVMAAVGVGSLLLI